MFSVNDLDSCMRLQASPCSHVALAAVAPSDLAVRLTSPVETDPLEGADGGHVVGVTASEDDIDVRLGTCPSNEGAGRLGCISATPTAGDDAVADLDRASVVGRPAEANVADHACTAALDHHPDAKALSVHRCAGVTSKHTKKMRIRPLCRESRTQGATRCLPMLRQGRGRLCRQGLQLQVLGEQTEHSRWANLLEAGDNSLLGSENAVKGTRGGSSPGPASATTWGTNAALRRRAVQAQHSVRQRFQPTASDRSSTHIADAVCPFV
jgi:hypothetical protein